MFSSVLTLPFLSFVAGEIHKGILQTTHQEKVLFNRRKKFSHDVKVEPWHFTICLLCFEALLHFVLICFY